MSFLWIPAVRCRADLMTPRAYVAQGQFPVPLMCEWDSYNHERGSENLRPDFYEDDQLFAIIMLENGGTDLEHSALACWQEAADVFWQVAFALARGEKAREFEVVARPNLRLPIGLLTLPSIEISTLETL